VTKRSGGYCAWGRHAFSRVGSLGGTQNSASTQWSPRLQSVSVGGRVYRRGMPYKQPFLKLVVSGLLYKVETFSFGLSLIDPNVPGGAGPPPNSVPGAIVNAVTALFGSPIICYDAQVTTIKLNQIGTNGRYMNNETVLHEYVPPSGGGATATPPPQIAWCVSLATAAARGRAHAGRFYLPLPSAQVVHQVGALGTGQVQQDLIEVDKFLKAVDGAIPGYRIGVVSNLGTGEQRVVTHARYGAVLDTIRSRRTKIAENYQVGTPLRTGAP
jgi:hypothetical protein